MFNPVLVFTGIWYVGYPLYHCCIYYFNFLMYSDNGEIDPLPNIICQKDHIVYTIALYFSNY